MADWLTLKQTTVGRRYSDYWIANVGDRYSSFTSCISYNIPYSIAIADRSLHLPRFEYRYLWGDRITEVANQRSVHVG